MIYQATDLKGYKSKNEVQSHIINEKNNTISKLESKILEHYQLMENKERDLIKNSIGFQEEIPTNASTKVNENCESVNFLFKKRFFEDNIPEIINSGIKRKLKMHKKAKHYYLRSTARKYEFLSKYIQDNKESLCFSCDSDSEKE